MMKPYLEQVYNEAQNAKRRAAEFINLEQTSLRLGLMCTIAPDNLFDFIKAVLDPHSGISCAKRSERNGSTIFSFGVEVSTHALS